MAWWSKPREGKRIANWLVVVVVPVLVALTLANPRPLHWWQYMGLIIWPLLGLQSAYQLITGKKADA